MPMTVHCSLVPMQASLSCFFPTNWKVQPNKATYAIASCIPGLLNVAWCNRSTIILWDVHVATSFTDSTFQLLV